MPASPRQMGRLRRQVRTAGAERRRCGRPGSDGDGSGNAPAERMMVGGAVGRRWARGSGSGGRVCRRGRGGRGTRPTRARRWRPTRRRCASWRGCPQWTSWTRGCRSAGPARGWSPGGRRSRSPAAPPSPPSRTGAARRRASGRPTPGSRCVGPGAGRARRQPHRPGLHRRPQRRLALRRAVPGRPRQPADLGARRRRPGAARHPGHRLGPLRPAGEQADPGRAGHLPALAGHASCSCSGPRCG